MAWAMQKPFNNVGLGANAAGVCEAAVCLWLQYIQARVGKFNWGSSAGDYLPTTAAANTLYDKFEDGTYLCRFLSALKVLVFPGVAANNKAGDYNDAESLGVVACSHYSGSEDGADQYFWSNLIDNTMARGDALFLNLTHAGSAEGHAVGVYKGSDYIWVFDPNSGLYRGNVSDGCCSSADIHLAAIDLAKLTQGYWDHVVYFGIHMRA